MPTTPRNWLLWATSAFCLAMGGVFWAAAAIGRQGSVGAGMFGILTAAAVLLVVAGRTEFVSGLMGANRDERWQLIDLRATAITAIVLILALFGGFVNELVQGHTGAPYTWLAATGGLTYALAVTVFAKRS
ncbi:MAG: hypothetical protein ACRDHX_00935 [Chloroflexota bacterium]